MKPDLIKDYDAVGFDTSLVAFNTHRLARLAAHSLLKGLMECFPQTYSEEVVKTFDFDRLLKLDFRENSNFVWDISKGVLIRLGTNKEVLQAVRGFDVLD